ncbi:hypothetical protein ACWOBX_01780 [Facklamia languida]
MGKIETLQKTIIDKVQATGEAQVQNHQATLSDQLDQFKARLADQLHHQKESYERNESRKFDIRQQSLANELRNQKLTHKQGLLKDIIREVAPQINEMAPEEFIQLIQHVIGKVDASRAFTLQLGANSKDKVSQEAVEGFRAQFPQMQVTEEAIANKSGFLISQDGMNFNYLFEDVVDELIPQLLIELEHELKA